MFRVILLHMLVSLEMVTVHRSLMKKSAKRPVRFLSVMGGWISARNYPVHKETQTAQLNTANRTLETPVMVQYLLINNHVCLFRNFRTLYFIIGSVARTRETSE